MSGVKVLRVSDRTFLLHLGGKIEVISEIPLNTRDDLSMIYTPGVARVCRCDPCRSGRFVRADHSPQHGGGDFRRLGDPGAGQLGPRRRCR